MNYPKHLDRDATTPSSDSLTSLVGASEAHGSYTDRDASMGTKIIHLSRHPLEYQWLSQIQTQAQQDVWFHIPDHKQSTIKLRVHNNQIIFGPRKNGRLFLDYKFYKDHPELVAELHNTVGINTPGVDASLCKAAERSVDETSRGHIARMLFRMIQDSATLIGVRAQTLKCTRAKPLTIEKPLTFRVEELMPPHHTSNNDEDTSLFEQLQNYTSLAWQFQRAPQPTWTTLINGPKHYDIKQTEHLMDAVTALTPHSNTNDMQSWIGRIGAHVWAFIWTKDSILACRMTCTQLALVTPLISLTQQRIRGQLHES